MFAAAAVAFPRFIHIVESCGKFMEFEVHIFQAWKVLELGLGHGVSWKTNICSEKFWHVLCVT